MTDTERMVFQIPAGATPRRIDKIIRDNVPSLGTRGAKRMVGQGLVLVDGQIASPMRKVRSGQTVEILPASEEDSPAGVRLLQEDPDYFFFFKPGGMHSAAIAGKGGANFENAARKLVPADCPIFLQRLDFGTSGIICAARNQQARESFRLSEKNNLCRKHYLALLKGEIREPLIVKFRIRAGFAKSTTSSEPASPDRWTSIMPLYFFPESKTPFQNLSGFSVTLAACAISRGMRHQIRVHASAAGHPLAGDPLYDAGDRFYLDHFMISFPGHGAISIGEGSLFRQLQEEAQNAVLDYIKKQADMESA